MVCAYVCVSTCAHRSSLIILKLEWALYLHDPCSIDSKGIFINIPSVIIGHAYVCLSRLRVCARHRWSCAKIQRVTSMCSERSEWICTLAQVGKDHWLSLSLAFPARVSFSGARTISHGATSSCSRHQWHFEQRLIPEQMYSLLGRKTKPSSRPYLRGLACQTDFPLVVHASAVFADDTPTSKRRAAWHGRKKVLKLTMSASFCCVDAAVT